jgi:hypothetical protein
VTVGASLPRALVACVRCSSRRRKSETGSRAPKSPETDPLASPTARPGSSLDKVLNSGAFLSGLLSSADPVNTSSSSK